MIRRLTLAARFGLFVACVVLIAALAPVTGRAAPYADMVMDARTGEVFRATNADTRLHPASLTKMMTLYIAFQAVQRGEISLDTEVTITAEAAEQPPSRLGLRAGQTIRMRYLLRAAAVKSANDAATAIGIALAGSHEAFAARMNATAAAMGMDNSHFVNMNGLTAEGHYSSAHDMTILGRHLIYDFPQYYNLFSRRSADAGIAEVANTNRRFLDSYPGADGIKTGFTNAAGYNLVASAERGSVRIIATVFGGTSTAQRNQRVAELLDFGFSQAQNNVAVRAPEPPGYYVTAGSAQTTPPAAQDSDPGGAGRTIRVSGQVTVSLRPMPRPDGRNAPLADDALVASVDGVEDALAEALGLASGGAPAPEPEPQVAFAGAADAQPETLAALAAAQEAMVDRDQSDVSLASAAPEPPPAEIIMTAEAIAPAESTEAEPTELVTRVSTSGGRTWGITLGSFNSYAEAERFLLQAVLAESTALDGGLRRVNQRAGGFEANVIALSRDQADAACRRFQARGVTCFMVGTEEG